MRGAAGARRGGRLLSLGMPVGSGRLSTVPGTTCASASIALARARSAAEIPMRAAIAAIVSPG